MITKIAAALFFVTLLAAPAGASAGELEDLVRKADNAYRARTAAAVLSMHVEQSSYERDYKIVSWDDRRGDRERVLVKILGPALWRGYGTLKVGRQLKLYDPKTNHVTVVSHSMMGDSWMGSHFTNDDLVHETDLAEDYELSLDRKWKEGGSTYYRVKMRPKPRAPVPWNRILYTLKEDGDTVLPQEAKYYRKAQDEEPSRIMKFSAPKEMDGRLIPTEITLRPTDEPGEFTRLTYEKLKFNLEIPSSKFTEQALRK